MRKTLKIAQREIIEMLKSKFFLLSVFLTPAIMVALIFFSAKMGGDTTSKPRPPKKIAVSDLTGRLAGDLEAAFKKYNDANSGRRYALEPALLDEDDPEAQTRSMKARIRKGALGGYLVIPEEALEGQGRVRLYQKTGNLSEMRSGSTLRRLVNEAVTNRRTIQRGLSPELIAELGKPLPFEQIEVAAQEGKQRNVMAAMMVPFFFMFLMFMGIFGMSQQLLTSVIEEKSSRVMEVLLSTVSPMQLMTGKILGMAFVGMGLVCVWGGAAYAAAVSRGISDLARLDSLGYFAVYYVLGFLLFASMLAAIGAMCNTMKDAQAFTMPVTILVILPMMVWLPITQNPEGLLAVVMSLIPPMTPLIMIARLAAQPELPVTQIAGSIAILALSIPLVVRLSAKIFRVGVLMYGKPPTPREIVRWIREY
jgi:ABC-2 type transport system permease protein